MQYHNLSKPFTAPHRHIRIRQHRPRECDHNGQGRAADRILWVPRRGELKRRRAVLLEALAAGRGGTAASSSSAGLLLRPRFLLLLFLFLFLLLQCPLLSRLLLLRRRRLRRVLRCRTRLYYLPCRCTAVDGGSATESQDIAALKDECVC